jgi:Nif-specific regulatory protein
MNENSTHKLNALIDLASLLGQQSDFQEVLRLVTQTAAAIIQSDIALLMMLNPQTRETVKTIYSKGREFKEQKYHFIHTNISGWVIDNNCSFLTNDLANDHRFRKNLFKECPIISALCIPLRIEGILVGTLLLLNITRGHAFSEEDLSILEKLAAIASPFLRDVQKIQQFFIAPLPKSALLKKYEATGLLGKSEKFIELLHAVEAAVRTSVRILLEGESGTGKELVARSIHQFSSRSHNKFMAIDCGAIPAYLIESELFGHVKGAFTGASTGRKGLMEEADGGTLFMDEISNIPVEMQSKLLRLLQEGEIRPLGGNQVRKVDVRIITASSVSLRTLVDKQLFREDLFYRLHVYPISVPPLDERREDIPVLANHFLVKFSHEQSKQMDSIHGDLLDFMKLRDWQGNIRELANFVERLVTLAPAEKKILEMTIVPQEFLKEWNKIKRVHVTDQRSRPLSESLAEYEEKLLRTALTENDWNQSKAARALSISEQTIRYKMGKLGIIKPD